MNADSKEAALQQEDLADGDIILCKDGDQYESSEWEVQEKEKQYTYITHNDVLYHKCLRTNKLTRIPDYGEIYLQNVLKWVAVLIVIAILVFSAPVSSIMVVGTAALFLAGYAISLYVSSSPHVQRRKAIQKYEEEREQIILESHKLNTEMQNTIEVHAEIIDKKHFGLISGATFSYQIEKKYIEKLIAATDKSQNKVLEKYKGIADRINQSIATCPHCKTKIQFQPSDEVVLRDCQECQRPIQFPNRDKIYLQKRKR